MVIYYGSNKTTTTTNRYPEGQLISTCSVSPTHLPPRHKHTHTRTAHTHIRAVSELLSLWSFRMGSFSSFKAFDAQHCHWDLLLVCVILHLSSLLSPSAFSCCTFSLPHLYLLPCYFSQSLGFLLINTCIFFFSVRKHTALCEVFVFSLHIYHKVACGCFSNVG